MRVLDPLRYPMVGFRFRVEFADLGILDQAFQEVGGLETNIETETVGEGGEYGFSYTLPKRIKQSPLTLKRGLTPVDANLSAWVRDALEDFKFKPMLVTINLVDATYLTLMSWQASQAWPLGWSLSGFNANSNELVIETLKLAYAHLRRVK